MPEQLPHLSLNYGPPSADSGEVRCLFRDLNQHPVLPLCLRLESFSGANTGPHCHLDFLALYWVQEGTGIHHIDGIGYFIAPGDVYLLPAGSTHEYRNHNGLKIWACYFTPHLFAEAELVSLREKPEFWNLFLHQSPIPPVGTPSPRLRLTERALQEVAALWGHLQREWGETKATGPLLLRGGVYRLLVELARLPEESAESPPLRRPGPSLGPETPGLAPHGPPHGPPVGPSVAAIVEFCERNYAQALTVPQLAARMFVSPGHFSELFTRETGLPPKAWLRRLRLEKARDLLATTDRTLTGIALATGFCDSAHLCRAYRAHYDQSPGAYRRWAATGRAAGRTP